MVRGEPKPIVWMGSSREDLRRFPQQVRSDIGKAPYYVLHAFQKKATSGIATPQKDIELIRRRLIEAGRLHRERQN